MTTRSPYASPDAPAEHPDAPAAVVSPDDARYGIPSPSEMFPVEMGLRVAFQQRDADLADTLGVPTADRTTEYRAFTQTIRESGLEAAGMGQLLFNASVDARIAEAHGRGAPDVQALNEAARAALAATYGRTEAEALLARTAKFVAQHPKLAAVLQTRGIGSRLDVVTGLAEHMRRVNFR